MTEFQIFGLIVLIFFPLVCWWQISATNALTHSQREAVRELRRLPWNRGRARSWRRTMAHVVVCLLLIIIFDLLLEGGKTPPIMAVLLPLPFLIHAGELSFRHKVWHDAGLSNAFLLREAIANWYGVLLFGLNLFYFLFIR